MDGYDLAVEERGTGRGSVARQKTVFQDVPLIMSVSELQDQLVMWSD